MFTITKIVKHLPVVRLVDSKYKRTMATALVIVGTVSFFLAGNYASAQGMALLSSAS
jgi:hypothetical protein